MSKVTIRADELCGKHIGMYYGGHVIQHVTAGDDVELRNDNGSVIGEFDLDDMVTLSDTPTPDLPTEDGALVAATYGSRRQVFLRWNNAWESKWDRIRIDNASWLSDVQELVAVPKNEYEALAEAVNSQTSCLRPTHPAHRLVRATDALESSLT